MEQEMRDKMRREREDGWEKASGGEKKETVLVTGATGFLGQYLVRRLVKHYRVLALGRDREKGQELAQMGAVFCPGDFTKEGECAGYFQGVEYVIHAGALSTVWGRWEDFYQTNVQGTVRIARWCHENHVRRMVYLSSPSIYTAKEDQYDIDEGDAPEENNLNGYIRSKLMAERELRRWMEAGLEIVILRPRGLIGIGDTSLVPRLMRANEKTGIPLFRGGENLVDLTSVENVALACELAMTAEGAAGQVFHITNGEPTRFRELLERFLAAAGEIPHYRRLPFGLLYPLAGALECVYRLLQLPGEPPLTRYTVCTLGFAQTMDISRAREVLGYRPEKRLQESIAEYGEWWKREKEKKSGAKEEAGEQRRPEEPPDHGPQKVTRVKLYHCGYCVNDLAVVFRGRKGERRRFPASAVLIQHRELGNILYDTGYSEKIFGSGVILKLYRMLNPVFLEEGQRIDERLAADGISPESIGTILLSHAHPDHVGGLSRFSGYRLVALKEVWESMAKPGIRGLVFKSQLPGPEQMGCWCMPEKRLRGHFLCRYFEEVYDLLGDGSVTGVRLDGHSRGQMGLWIPDQRLFLAADACWGGDLVPDTLRMRWIPRLIQSDYAEYCRTLQRICRMKRENPWIQVVFAHQRGEERSYE